MFLTDLGSPISRGWNLKAKNLNSRVTWCNFYRDAAVLMIGLGFSVSPSPPPAPSSLFKPEEDTETVSRDQEGKELFTVNWS